MARPLLIFDTHGPVLVPLRREKGGSYIEPRWPNDWRDDPLTEKVREKKGCYVFAIRAGRGYKPIYVGKTARSFEVECFAFQKVAYHYTPALARKARGAPVMFFVTPRVRRGKPNARIIKDLETFLIQVASAKNPELSNVQGRKEARWGIQGVLRAGKGKPGKSARAFKAAVGI
jgi:hypothetical protein